jgi:hypothetical protein
MLSKPQKQETRNRRRGGRAAAQHLPVAGLGAGFQSCRPKSTGSTLIGRGIGQASGIGRWASAAWALKGAGPLRLVTSCGIVTRGAPSRVGHGSLKSLSKKSRETHGVNPSIYSTAQPGQIPLGLQALRSRRCHLSVVQSLAPLSRG